jgi:hypothetical protein
MGNSFGELPNQENFMVIVKKMQTYMNFLQAQIQDWDSFQQTVI